MLFVWGVGDFYFYVSWTKSVSILRYAGAIQSFYSIFSLTLKLQIKEGGEADHLRYALQNMKALFSSKKFHI